MPQKAFVNTRVPEDPDALLTVEQAALLLGLSKFFIWEHIRKKKPLIPCIRISRRCTRFRREDLRKFAEELARRG